MRLLRSEIAKLRATPTMWWLLLGTTGLAVAATIGAVVLAKTAGEPLGSEQAVRGYLHSVGSGSILVVIAGIIGAAGEFRFGQADQTFISEPVRGRVIGAKVVVFVVLGAMFGVVAAAATLGSAWLAVRTQGQTVSFGADYVWSTLGGAVASAAVFGALGVGIGSLMRNQVSAIVATLAWLVILEPIVFQASAGVGKWLPGEAAQALRKIPEQGLLSMAAGAAVVGIWTLAVVAAGFWRTSHRDIS